MSIDCVIHILSIFLHLLNILWNYFFVFDYYVENELKGEGSSGEGRCKVNRSWQAGIHACLDAGTDTLGTAKDMLPGPRTYDLCLGCV